MFVTLLLNNSVVFPSCADNLQTELDKIRCLSKTAYQRMTAAAVSVTLDNETAHPSLKVSSDQTTVSYVSGDKIPTDTDRSFILGKNGYTSGRHFWEVEVESHVPWDLGVARESVDRKANQPLNPENGYWTIGHDGHKYSANDAIPLEISVKGKLQRIGIYVNYEAGQVLFCDPATFRHLHSFTSSFEGTIYPFFNLSQSSKVVIFPLATLKNLNNCT
ncbi:butyrophilin subfamily 1 member A1-like [Mustelus asterias]